MSLHEVHLVHPSVVLVLCELAFVVLHKYEPNGIVDKRNDGVNTHFKILFAVQRKLS